MGKRVRTGLCLAVDAGGLYTTHVEGGEKRKGGGEGGGETKSQKERIASAIISERMGSTTQPSKIILTLGISPASSSLSFFGSYREIFVSVSCVPLHSSTAPPMHRAVQSRTGARLGIGISRASIDCSPR